MNPPNRLINEAVAFAAGDVAAVALMPMLMADVRAFLARLVAVGRIAPMAAVRAAVVLYVLIHAASLA